MEPSQLSLVVGISQGFWESFRLSLTTIPESVRVILSWYGPGEPDELPQNVSLVRPRRHTDNYMRGYVLNVAIRAVETPYVLIGDADFLYPSVFFDSFSHSSNAVLRCYVGRLTPDSSALVRQGKCWESLFCDYQGTDLGGEPRVFGQIFGGHNPCIYPTRLLHQLRGYDEQILGWGGEDDDLSFRTRRTGVAERRLPILVADLYHGESPDYSDSYHRGKTSQANLDILNDQTRPAAANFDGWGDDD